jgi:hypothetical protein
MEIPPPKQRCGLSASWRNDSYAFWQGEGGFPPRRLWERRFATQGGAVRGQQEISLFPETRRATYDNGARTKEARVLGGIDVYQRVAVPFMGKPFTTNGIHGAHGLQTFVATQPDHTTRDTEVIPGIHHEDFSERGRSRVRARPLLSASRRASPPPRRGSKLGF